MNESTIGKILGFAKSTSELDYLAELLKKFHSETVDEITNGHMNIILDTRSQIKNIYER